MSTRIKAASIAVAVLVLTAGPSLAAAECGSDHHLVSEKIATTSQDTLERPGIAVTVASDQTQKPVAVQQQATITVVGSNSERVSIVAPSNVTAIGIGGDGAPGAPGAPAR